MHILIWSLALGIALFQFVDFWTTTQVLARGGTELNPFMRMLFKGVGVRTGLVFFKFYVVVLALAGACFGWFENRSGFVLLLALFALYGAVVINNLRVYHEQK